METFDQLSDHLAIVRPAQRFGAFRFEFFGSVLAEIGPYGDLSKVAFHDLLDSAYFRAILAGFRHVRMTGLPHVTRNHPIVGGGAAYFTRLLVPVFARNGLALILCASVPHDAPQAMP